MHKNVFTEIIILSRGILNGYIAGCILNIHCGKSNQISKNANNISQSVFQITGLFHLDDPAYRCILMYYIN